MDASGAAVSSRAASAVNAPHTWSLSCVPVPASNTAGSSNDPLPQRPPLVNQNPVLADEPVNELVAA
jgi:hypothetical protein